MTHLYVLRLQQGHMYIGTSDNPVEDYLQHLHGTLSTWTLTYKPIGIDRLYYDICHIDAESVIQLYIREFGIDKVHVASPLHEYKKQFVWKETSREDEATD